MKKLITTLALLTALSANAEIYTSKWYGISADIPEAWEVISGKDTEKAQQAEVDKEKFASISERYKSRPSITIFSVKPETQSDDVESTFLIKYVHKDVTSVKLKARKIIGLYKSYYQGFKVLEKGIGVKFKGRDAHFISLQYVEQEGQYTQMDLWLTDEKDYFYGLAKIHIFKNDSAENGTNHLLNQSKLDQLVKSLNI